MSAGCLFTDGVHVLAGLQKGGLNGFGGKAEYGEPVYITAWRETLEELFGFCTDTLLYEIITFISYTNVIVDPYYTCYVYTFTDLEKVLSIIRKYHMPSPFYRRFPRTLFELIFLRRAANTEVQTLALLPMYDDLHVAPEFQSDITLIKRGVVSTPSGYCNQQGCVHPRAACQQK
jgi:hypothetical protein